MYGTSVACVIMRTDGRRDAARHGPVPPPDGAKCVWSGPDCPQTAQALGVPVGTERSRPFRARAGLRAPTDQRLEGDAGRKLRKDTGRKPEGAPAGSRKGTPSGSRDEAPAGSRKGHRAGRTGHPGRRRGPGKSGETVTVGLDRPVGDRVLLDASTGRPVPYREAYGPSPGAP
ncbi:hypothetical protein GCM10010358_44100 [Streptomyces minutiscleroticus]|uniref:Uncharacterized protein n=1 Tax=Streptomyces minutiscleroticus TaxID=68238 RepID=A0A918NPE7_9ACTN|nr:hypothetical protein GCM10010358_44100 [Streptomyces minutiscleroticus]